jgi:hypothetical protein
MKEIRITANFLKQNPSWEAYIRAADREINRPRK